MAQSLEIKDGHDDLPQAARGLWLQRQTPFVYSSAPEQAVSETTSIIVVAAALIVLATLFFSAV